MCCRQLINHRRRGFIATYGAIRAFAPVFEYDFVVAIIASVTHLAKSEDDPMKQEAQVAHVRKDPTLPSDTTAQSVSNSVRFTVRNQRNLFFQVTPRYLTFLGLSRACSDAHTQTANSCILLTTNRRMMSSWFCWIRSKRVSTSAILLSSHTLANRK